MMTYLFQISLVISFLSYLSGQNTRKSVEFSCEKELDILTKDLEDLIDDWLQIKNQIYGECSAQSKFHIQMILYLCLFMSPVKNHL